ncbi:MAG TPA: hypothetical protein VLD65_10085 [Anaerolineales bacterium]|nr:hypothetical protein [Anaerolineales bacterium]
MNEDLIQACKEILREVSHFCVGSGIRLRSYQKQVAESIVDSTIRHKGLSFVVIFPRQSGKNELQAQLEAYLLSLCSVEPTEIVKVSPTWKPQSLNAMRRLERVLKRNLICHGRWKKRSGYIYQFGDAVIHFLSGAPTSNIVGATASLLLECDEAQDVEISKWDKEIAPMAASTNATRVFWGTAWTSKTLLARELRAARLQEQQDGIRRTWVLTCEEVGDEVTAYRKYVNEQVARLGRNNPLVRTQYYSEEIDSEGGIFPLRRRMLMLGSHPRQSEPIPGKAYAFTIDVAGQDESAMDLAASLAGGLTPGSSSGLANPGRDSTVLTIFELDNISVDDPLLGKPTYRVVNRYVWQGVRHSQLYGSLLNLAELWSPIKVIIDATGVGAGLASFLIDRFGSRLLPFQFNQASKSELGWGFITVIETGRYKEFHPMDEEMSRQLEYCQYSILEGPAKVMRWGVPNGQRDVTTGELVHDDYIMSAALVSLLDHEAWGSATSQVVHSKDILEEMRF